MLFTCPDCENKISEAAEVCPKCGCPCPGKRSIEAANLIRDNFFAMQRQTPNALAKAYCPTCRKRNEIKLKDIDLKEMLNMSGGFGYTPMWEWICPGCGNRVSGDAVWAGYLKRYQE